MSLVEVRLLVVGSVIANWPRWCVGGSGHGRSGWTVDCWTWWKEQLARRNRGGQADDHSWQAAVEKIVMKAIAYGWAMAWQLNLGMAEAVMIAG